MSKKKYVTLEIMTVEVKAQQMLCQSFGSGSQNESYEVVTPSDWF